MNPKAIIESYVGEVVRHLPRRQRNDIAFELRSLLTEDLDGRASESGRPADEALAIELLTEFGRPQDVADRYRPAGFTIIRPADAPGFAWIALGGLVLQWVITLPVVLLDPAGYGEWLTRLGTWWLSWGLGAFWWPGFLITLTMIAAAISHRRGRSEAPWVPPREIDRDRVNRFTMVFLTALGVVGASVVLALPTLAYWAPGLPQPVIEAFAFDPVFLAWKAPWVILLWLVELALAIIAIVRGRWDRTLRRVSQASGVAWIALSVFWVVSGDIFVSDSADSVTKLCLVFVALMMLVVLIISVRRTPAGIREPAV